MGDEKASKAPKIEAQPALERADTFDPARVGTGSMFAWQDQFGNAALTRLLAARTPHVQPKLSIGRRDSPHEREAERVASLVVSSSSAVPSIRNRTEADVEVTATPALQSSLGALRGSGEPLPAATRSALEPRFNQDFSDVRVHTGNRAADAARAIHARAFTTGRDIVFASGQFRPDSRAGQTLLAHELTHVIQQRESRVPILQGDFESDFAGRTAVPVDENTTRPARTIRVQTYATQTEPAGWVYAPYGIYPPADVPEAYRDRIMDSTKSSEWRVRGQGGEWPPVEADLQREIERTENRLELTVRDMLALSQGSGRAMNIRVIMAKIGNDFRFVGYDMAEVAGTPATGYVITSGFVEAEAETTRGVGQALFADRVVRTLAIGAAEMRLEVYHYQRTEDFHARIWAVIRRPGPPPTQGTRYELTTREMIRVALAWNEHLTPAEFLVLRDLERQRTEPTPADAEIAWRGAVERAGRISVVPSSTGIAGVIDTDVPGPWAPGGAPRSGGGARPAEQPAEQTSAMGRLQRLLNAQETMRIWRPVVDAQGADQKRAVDEELTRIDASVTDLAQRLRATDAAARARVTGPLAISAADAAYEATVKALAAPTASETSIGDTGFRGLEELRQRPIEQVPVQVALNEAFRTGRYSDQAFRYLLAQLDPATRDSILYGRGGKLRPRYAQFRRLVAQSDRNPLPSGDTTSTSGMSGGKLVVTRGAAGALLVIEAANFAMQAYQSYQLSQQTQRRKNFYPFAKRLLFWDQLGVRPAVVGVDDDLFQWSPNYERDYDTVVKDLGDWDALFIEDTPERPCLSDTDVMYLAANLGSLVRNYDEFARLFLSSGQTAVTWDTTPGEGWAKAKWFVRVGEYDTNWQNSVEERWAYVPKLNEVMNVLAARIIANTEELLKLQAEGKALPGEDSPLGGFLAWGPGKGGKRARLRDNESKTTVYTQRIKGWTGDYPAGDGERIPREVTWWSPPVFYVHDYKRMGFVTVTGADYNTYAVLRRTSYEVMEKGSTTGNYDKISTHLAENAKAVVEIPWLLLDIAE